MTGRTDDHGDSTETGTLIELGTPTPGELWDIAAESDWFRFEVQAGSGYAADLQSDAFEFSSFSVWRPDGKLVDRKSVSDGRIEWVPTISGTYTVHIRSSDVPAESGKYILTVTGRADDHGNDRETATLLVEGLPEPGEIDYTGDVDMFAFDAQKGWIYQLTTTNVTGLVVEELLLGELDYYKGDKREEGNQSVINGWVAPSTRRYYYRLDNIVQSGANYVVEVSGEPDDHVDLPRLNPADPSPDATPLNMKALPKGRFNTSATLTSLNFRRKGTGSTTLERILTEKTGSFPGMQMIGAPCYPDNTTCILNPPLAVFSLRKKSLP